MNKDVARLWLEALRSDEYTQGQGSLIEIDQDNGDVIGHCCLGVLCEVAIKAGVPVVKIPGEPEVDDSYTYGLVTKYARTTFGGRSDVLPLSVADWAGIGSSDGTLPWYVSAERRHSLAEMNDSGYSFAEIAHTIEENVEDL